MSILIKLAARHVPTRENLGPDKDRPEFGSSYETLRSRIQAAEMTMARTQSSTTMGGIDYDTDDNDHR